MAAAADVVADPALHRLVDRGHLVGGQAVAAEQTVDRVGGLGGEEFAAGVAPAVLHRAGDVERARGNERQQQVLVERQIVLGVVIAVEVVAKPVREGFVDMADGFAVAPARQRGAAAAGFVGDDQGEARVAGAGPQRGFAQSRETEYGDIADIGVGL